MKKANAFILILTLLGIIPSFSHSQGTIHDAVFSPDGSTIAVGGTKGVYLYRFDDMVLMDTIQTPNDVQFIRWSPDMRYLIVAHWDDSDENSLPVYSILDVSAKRMLFDIKDSIRWFGRMMERSGSPLYPENVFFRGLLYFYDKPNKWPLYPNCINFSPDSLYIGLIDDLNQIQIYDISKEALVRTFNRYDKSPIAIDTKIIAVKPLAENSVELSDLRSGVFKLGVYKEIGTNNEIDYLSKDYYMTGGFPAFEWTNDHTYALLTEPAQEANSRVNMNIYLCKLNKNSQKMDSSNFDIPETIPVRQRGAFVKNNTMAITLSHRSSKNLPKEEMSIIAMDMDYKVIFSRSAVVDRLDPLLMQPFSPDGENFLMLQDGSLVLYKSTSFRKQILLPKQNGLN